MLQVLVVLWYWVPSSRAGSALPEEESLTRILLVTERKVKQQLLPQIMLLLPYSRTLFFALAFYYLFFLLHLALFSYFILPRKF
jgi:hypothetical protein